MIKRVEMKKIAKTKITEAMNDIYNSDYFRNKNSKLNFQTYANGAFQCELSEYGYNLTIKINQSGNVVACQETLIDGNFERIEVLDEQLEYDENDVEEKLTNMFEYLKRSILGFPEKEIFE